MNIVTVTRSYGVDGCPFPFFQPEYYKIYNDGGHYVATPVFHSAVKRRERCGKRRVSETDEALRIAFDSIYYQAQRERVKNKALPEYIKVRLLKLFDDTPELDKFIEKRIERMPHNAYVRKKRFRRFFHFLINKMLRVVLRAIHKRSLFPLPKQGLSPYKYGVFGIALLQLR